MDKHPISAVLHRLQSAISVIIIEYITMPQLHLIDLRTLDAEGPTAEGPDGESQQVFLRQGDMDGACGGLDILAAALIDGARRLQAAGFNLSVFNVSNTNFYEPTSGWVKRGLPTVENLFARMQRPRPDNIGAGGVRSVRNIAKSARALGLGHIITSIEHYATRVHPLEGGILGARTEKEWAHEYADSVH